MKNRVSNVKKVIWVGSSYEDFMEFPPPVCNAVGYALYHAQLGQMHFHTKVLSGMGSAGVLEIRENDSSGTYRVMYTVEMADIVFVLHAFQKKSKIGKATPKQEMELLKNRLRDAKALYKDMTEGKKK
ncbi:MAG: type II toxin-antitoxin system RelE/ParE family toxin [Chlamydiota bacterium]